MKSEGRRARRALRTGRGLQTADGTDHRPPFPRVPASPRPRVVLLVWLFGAVAAWPAGVRGQDVVAGDRPGFGDGSGVLAPRHVQVEAGYAYSETDEIRRHAVGQVLLRFGVAPRVEVRAGLNSYVVLDDYDDTAGFEDLVLGIKASLLPGGAGQPALSALVSAALPTGADRLTADAVRPDVKLVLDMALTPVLAFSGNAGYAFSLDTHPDGVIATYASLGVGLPAADGLSAFAGLYSLFPVGDDTEHGLDAGFIYLLDAATQLDLNVGTGLTEGLPTVVIGAGIARRF